MIGSFNKISCSEYFAREINALFILKENDA